jgi:hypothetical protein
MLGHDDPRTTLIKTWGGMLPDVVFKCEEPVAS